MNLNSFRWLPAVVIGFFLTANPVSGETSNALVITNASQLVTRDEMTQNYLRLQEQIHETQMAIVRNQEVTANAARTNADALAAQLQSLETALAAQRANAAETARKTQQLTLFMAGVFGLAGLGIMLLMVYFQWRAFTQIAQISAQQHAVIADVSGGVQQLAAPGRAQVETSNARLLDVVGQLEKRIRELEGGQGFLPAASPAKPVDALAQAQKFLDANQPQLALDFLDDFLAEDAGNANALVKKAVALEKLGRFDEALVFCDRAIAMDRTLALAHLHKGGLLNRLRRYDEALDCYESALQAQEKKSASLVR
jgi:tetratricopeptide (TPR) repeat protein